METLILERTKEILKNKEILESKLGVKIEVSKKQVKIDGSAVDEYLASQVLEAIGFGFSAKKALFLTEEDAIFRKINIKDLTRRKKLKDVRARVIGSEGKTKRTIEDISNCQIVVNGNEIGIIGNIEDMEYTLSALQNLVKGSKEGNVYKYLEKANTIKKKEI